MEWIDAKERLPEPLEDVLVHYASGRIRIDARIPSGKYYIRSTFLFDDLYGVVTHWMPLPEPPKKEGSPCA